MLNLLVTGEANEGHGKTPFSLARLAQIKVISNDLKDVDELEFSALLVVKWLFNHFRK